MSQSGIPFVTQLANVTSTAANTITHPTLSNLWGNVKASVDTYTFGTTDHIFDKPNIPVPDGAAPTVPTANDTLTAQQNQAAQDARRQGRSSTYTSAGSQGLLGTSSQGVQSSARTLLGA